MSSQPEWVKNAKAQRPVSLLARSSQDEKECTACLSKYVFDIKEKQPSRVHTALLALGDEQGESKQADARASINTYCRYFRDTRVFSRLISTLRDAEVLVLSAGNSGVAPNASLGLAKLTISKEGLTKGYAWGTSWRCSRPTFIPLIVLGVIRLARKVVSW